jgi:hypothetical protein
MSREVAQAEAVRLAERHQGRSFALFLAAHHTPPAEQRKRPVGGASPTGG